MKALVKKLVVISVLLALMSGVNSYASNNVTEQSNISTNTVVTPTKNEAKPEVENKTKINNNVTKSEESKKNPLENSTNKKVTSNNTPVKAQPKKSSVPSSTPVTNKKQNTVIAQQNTTKVEETIQNVETEEQPENIVDNNVLTLVEEQEESEKNEEEINQPNNKISIIPKIIIVIILLIFFIKIIKNKMKPNKHMKKRKNRKEKREIDRIRDRKLNAMIKKMTIDDD